MKTLVIYTPNYLLVPVLNYLIAGTMQGVNIKRSEKRPFEWCKLTLEVHNTPWGEEVQKWANKFISLALLPNPGHSLPFAAIQ